MASQLGEYDVVYFVVSSNYEENGEFVCHVRVSPKFASVEKAKAALPALKRIFPTCRIWRYRLRFDPSRLAAMERRRELLAELV